ncbi:MAG: PAC2 family protein [Candidatus Omnitrophica bacterium]|nr:PAC2 family protein [Candidatus Omnitrophota bacterium]
MKEIVLIKKPLLKKPILIACWPGMGEVSFRAGTFLAEAVKAYEFAYLKPERFFYFTASQIKKGILELAGLPFGQFYYYKNPFETKNSFGNDLIIFISNAQPDLDKALEYTSEILSLAEIFKVKTIITFASLPTPITHKEPSRVWFTATHPELNLELKKFNINHLTEGQIAGMNGLFLGVAKEKKFKGFCLLAEIPLYTIQIENPLASYLILSALSQILNLRIELSLLLEQAKLLEEEIDKFLGELKLEPTSAGPISEEEIQRLKKSLSKLGTLPASIKEKIESLFKEASKDISRAKELKDLLDFWNVYKDYEDRFLDLFKKKEL